MNQASAQHAAARNIGQFGAHHPDQKLLMICSTQLAGGSIRTPYFAAIATSFAHLLEVATAPASNTLNFA
jgi:hypothetical protein